MKKQSFQEVEFNNPLQNKINNHEIKGLSKKMGFLIVTPMIIVLIGVIMLMPVFSVRSLASNLFDAAGNHKAALVVDALNSKGLIDSWDILTSNFNKDECTIPRSQTITPDYDTLGFSAKSYVNVYPKKTGLNGSFALKSYFEGFNDLSDSVNYTYNETDLKIDLEKLELGGKFNVNLKSEVFNKADDALYVNPIEFQLETENESDTYTKKINEWYKGDYEFTQEQKNAINENNKILNEISTTPPEFLINENTIKEITNAVCDNIDDVKVFSYSDFSFGPGSEKYNLRPIEIDVSDKIFENLPTNIQNIANSMANDNILKQNIKNRYDDISTYLKNQDLSSGYMGENEFTDISKEDFDKKVDEAFEETRKSIKENPFPSDAFNFITDSTTVNQELIVYLGENDLDVSAVYSEVTLIPKDINSIPEDFRDELADGVVISTLVYDIRTDVNTVKKDLPTETKNIDSLVDDLGFTQLFEQLGDLNLNDLLGGNTDPIDTPEDIILEENPGFTISGGEDEESGFVEIN